MLPSAVYNFAKRQQELWNVLAAEQEHRWTEWKNTNAPVIVNDKPKFKKPDKQWWNDWQGWMRQKVVESNLGWEAESDIIDRFSTVLRHLSKGGSPKIQRRLTSFSIPHRYTGGGVSLNTLESSRAKRFRIKFPPSTAYWKNDRESRRDRVTNAWFQIEDKTVSMSVAVHREIPDDAIVKGVRLCGWKQSPVTGWLCHIVVTVEVPVDVPSMSTGKEIGIDVGWRKLDDDRLRVAVTYDGLRHKDVVLPLRFVKKHGIGEVSLERKRQCQIIKDNLLEQCKKQLAALGISVPVQARNGYLIRLLRDVATPADAFPILERWKQSNDSLQRKILMLDNAMVGRREHLYRECAASLKQYDVIRVENLDLVEMSDLEANKEAKRAGDYALWNSRERRKYAAVSTLIAAIKNVAGSRFEKVEAAWTTKVCSKCHAEFKTDGGKLDGECVECHRIVDQDWNAAENIFANRPPSDAVKEFATSA